MNSGKWGFPQGSKFTEENPRVCANREVEEEVGLDIRNKSARSMWFEVM